MFKVFKPFKVAHSHTSSIAEHIRQKADSLLKENIFTLSCGGSVGSLDNEFAFEVGSVVDIN
jgi:hypothetical protein